MQQTEVVVIGGGQAGLAMSRRLTDRGVTHVVLERGRVGERWRSERWDSLRLLTPKWMSRLPGWSYEGDDPDGFMTKDELVEYLEAYAASFDAPLRCGVTVTDVRRHEDGFLVQTDEGTWASSAVVIATGDCQTTAVPAFAADLSGDVVQMAPTRYRNPDQLPEGGVLVVGASSTGLQLAAELRRAGRAVTLSVGRHTRLPRRWRGRDILTWLDEMGILDERAGDVADLEASREQPSLQLVGTPEHETLDLGAAQRMGIRLVGRAVHAENTLVHFGDNLLEDVAAADLKLLRLLMRVDEHIAERHRTARVPHEEMPGLTDVPDAPASLDLEREGIRTVLWATGFRRSYPWLHVPVVDERGEIRHRDGVTPCPGLYVMGLRFLRTRKSSFIDGQPGDALALADHIQTHRRAPALS